MHTNTHTNTHTYACALALSNTHTQEKKRANTRFRLTTAYTPQIDEDVSALRTRILACTRVHTRTHKHSLAHEYTHNKAHCESDAFHVTQIDKRLDAFTPARHLTEDQPAFQHEEVSSPSTPLIFYSNPLKVQALLGFDTSPRARNSVPAYSPSLDTEENSKPCMSSIVSPAAEPATLLYGNGTGSTTSELQAVSSKLKGHLDPLPPIVMYVEQDAKTHHGAPVPLKAYSGPLGAVRDSGPGRSGMASEKARGPLDKVTGTSPSAAENDTDLGSGPERLDFSDIFLGLCGDGDDGQCSSGSKEYNPGNDGSDGVGNGNGSISTASSSQKRTLLLDQDVRDRMQVDVDSHHTHNNTLTRTRSLTITRSL